MVNGDMEAVRTGFASRKGIEWVDKDQSLQQDTGSDLSNI